MRQQRPKHKGNGKTNLLAQVAKLQSKDKLANYNLNGE